MNHLFIPPLIAAIATTTLLVVLGMLQVSLMFMTFAGIPLIFLGLRYPLFMVAISICLVSVLLLGISISMLLFFLAMIAVPVLLLLAHHARANPIGWVLADISVYGAWLLWVVDFMHQPQGGLSGMLRQVIAASDVSARNPELALQLETLTAHTHVVLLGAVVWWAVMFFYLSAWLAAKLYDARYDTNTSAFMVLGAFTPPVWMLALVPILAFLTMMPLESLRFQAMLAGFIILLPYGFSGAMYTPLRHWQGMRQGWMFLVMTIAMVLAWPILACAAMGVWKHAESLWAKK